MKIKRILALVSCFVILELAVASGCAWLHGYNRYWSWDKFLWPGLCAVPIAALGIACFIGLMMLFLYGIGANDWR